MPVECATLDELVRGEVSKLIGKNYDTLKDFSRLETLVSNLDIDKFLDMDLDDRESLEILMDSSLQYAMEGIYLQFL